MWVRRHVCANSSPFSAGGEKVCLYLRAPFPPSALWITVIVSFVALSRMTDYDQQDEWGQLIVEATRLARSACFFLIPARRSVYLFCSGYDSLHAPRGTGDATRPVKSHAGCRLPSADTQLNSWHSRWCLRPRQQQFPLRSGAHHPEAIQSQSGGHNCLVHICSKQENMQRFDSQKIRELF